jgi:type I restriction enzyme, R subunit
VIESASLKTIAAFLNSEFGGTLLIGAANDRSVAGLEPDYGTMRPEGRDDADVFLVHLNQLVENAVGLAAAANVMTTIHHVDGHDVCRVHVEASGHPVEAEVSVADRQGQFTKKRVLYIRLNNGPRAIEDEKERERYVVQRWGHA